MPTLEIILAAIQAAGTLTPEFVTLINALKTAFSADDQAQIEAAVAQADGIADQQHQSAQAE